jgi:hypothetical protein
VQEGLIIAYEGETTNPRLPADLVNRTDCPRLEMHRIIANIPEQNVTRLLGSGTAEPGTSSSEEIAYI